MEKPTVASDAVEKEYECYAKLERDIMLLEEQEDISVADSQAVEVKIAVANSNNELYYKTLDLVKQYEAEVEQFTTELATLSSKHAKLAVLLKAFGPKGIVGYKIESSVKVFEEQINRYLSVFTNGQFALTFKLDGSKLQVVIYDSGDETDMVSLSSGEAAKVNISTLLAIRNLMSSVSKVNMNVLFLDEVISVLDVESGDTLVEILLEEHDLNTFLVSHNYVHPLTKTLRIVKEGTESKIYNG